MKINCWVTRCCSPSTAVMLIFTVLSLSFVCQVNIFLCKNLACFCCTTWLTLSMSILTNILLVISAYKTDDIINKIDFNTPGDGILGAGTYVPLLLKHLLNNFSCLFWDNGKFEISRVQDNRALNGHIACTSVLKVSCAALSAKVKDNSFIYFSYIYLLLYFFQVSWRIKHYSSPGSMGFWMSQSLKMQ